MKANIFVQLARKAQLANGEKRFKELGTDYGCGKIYDLNYKNDNNESHNCDVYYPKGLREEKLPVIMEVHGGGFVTCTKFINEGHGLYYASRGYKVVNVNYTLMPEVTFLEEMQELFSAMHWIEDNADRYGFDMDRFYLSGDSAGGCHVLLMAAIQNSKELQNYFGVTPLASGICGVAASCPVTDVHGMMTSDKMLWKTIRALGFRSPKFREEDFIRHVSAPYTFQRSEFPRVFILTSPEDNLVHRDSAQTHEMLSELGIDHVYRVYDGRSHKLEHVWNVLYPQWEESVEANEDILAYFEEMANR